MQPFRSGQWVTAGLDGQQAPSCRPRALPASAPWLGPGWEAAANLSHPHLHLHVLMASPRHTRGTVRSPGLTSPRRRPAHKAQLPSAVHLSFRTNMAEAHVPFGQWKVPTILCEGLLSLHFCCIPQLLTELRLYFLMTVVSKDFTDLF